MILDNIIAGKHSALGEKTLQSTNPTTREELPEKFTIATDAEIDMAVSKATEAWPAYKNTDNESRATFLEAIATGIEDLGDVLVQQVISESGLPEGRVKGERGRTCGQLRAFATLVREGSWVDAIIDHGGDKKSDIRKVSASIGPVAVFTASNFPLAFSTAGGDSASALASGCPIIVKAHPSHLGTNALVSEVITKAAASTGMPVGVYSSLVGGISTGKDLVEHPGIKAIAFTGSHGGGKALMQLAQERPEPIPVYAEMGSNNPIFILSEKMAQSPDDLAKDIANSINMGAGQFCTNPGIIVVKNHKQSKPFLTALKTNFEKLPPATMLNEGIYKNFNNGKIQCVAHQGVDLEADQEETDDWKAQPGFASVPASSFLSNPKLQEEVFGPFTLVVKCESDEEVLAVAKGLQGQLTATMMGTDSDLTQSTDLIEVLSQKAGRVIFNGVPTGVAVCPAMHHGGPFPSTSNPLFTSVGADAIKRFVRPVTYQDAPDALLPAALQDANPLGIHRMVDGKRVAP